LRTPRRLAVATISSLLRDHVTLQVRSVDRLFLQAYVPKLMTSFQVVRFLLDHGNPIPSPALLGRIGRAYVAAIDRYAERHRIPVLRFGKGESKEQIARRYFRAAEREGRFGVVLIGVAQEKAMAWRGWRRGGSDGHPHFEFGRQAIFVNHYYFYIHDRDWGAGFVKTNAYAPYPVWVYLNGHEWAKRQAQKAGLGFRGARQRVSLGRGRGGAGGDLQPAVGARRPGVLPPLGGPAAVAAVGRGSPPRLPPPACVSSARAVRHARLRPARGGARVV
jgi:hypothetical protein